MRFSPQDEFRSYADELPKTKERNTVNELNPSIENNANEEYFHSEELPSPPPRNEKGGKAPRGGKQSAAIVAVLFTFTTAVGVIPLISSPNVSLTNKKVGFDSFYGELRFQHASDEAFEIILSDEYGERYDERVVEKGVKSLSYSFPYLRPEEKYILTVYDGKGKEYLSYSFETDPLFTLTETNDPQKLALSIHPDFPLSFDQKIELFDANGKNFSSNILLDPLATNYLYLEGLYANDYYLVATYYPTSEEEISHDKSLQLGSLTPLSYTASRPFDGLLLTYEAGDLAPYDSLELHLSEIGGTNYVVDSIDITVTDTQISVTLPVDLQSGSYDLALWGIFENEENQFYNEIWHSETNIDL